MSTAEDQNVECPLCMEPLEMDDINFFPCTCLYQICRFCWHRIRTDENGLCPACRKQYPEDPADFKPLSVEELHRIKNEKRQRDLQRKQKLSENRKHLANVRVVQKNLVFVVGLPPRLADADTLKKQDCFGKYGKTHKVVVNQSTSYAGLQGPSASAYVTYYKAEDALRAIQAVNNVKVDGRTLKASLGTTKYCNYFLRGQQCPKTDCMYLHELGDQAASFTKEEMQHGKHQEYERKLHEQMLAANNNVAAGAPPPAAAPAPATTAPKKANKPRKPGLAPRHARQSEQKAAAAAAAVNSSGGTPPSAKENRSTPPDDPSPTFTASLSPPSPESSRAGGDDAIVHEDDLGFDPWDECSKGLADLLEKEAVSATTSTAAVPRLAPSGSSLGGPPPALSTPLSVPMATSLSAPLQAPLSTLHHPRTSFLQPSRPAPPFEPLLRRPPPPPGFSPFLVGQSTSQKLVSLPTHQGGPAMPGAGNGLAELYALRESQEALRSLLPTVNITFGPPHGGGSPQGPHHLGPHLRGPSQFAANSCPPPPWGNGSVPDMPWIAQDPAILTGGSLSDAANMAARF